LTTCRKTAIIFPENRKEISKTMARPIRINFEGAYYHVINRGRGRMTIFRDQRDHREFLRLLGECCDQYQVHIVAYCLMSNHYHLLVCTPHANLPQFMRQLNGVYTQIFNRRYRLDGSLFRGRYKAIVVQEEFYLMRVVRYIHLNPKKAGIVKELEDYSWSSHRIYMEGVQKDRWLKYQDVMQQEWVKGENGLRAYTLFMNKDDDKEIEEFYKVKKGGAILGKNDYKDHIAQKYIHNKRYYGTEVPEQRRIIQVKRAEQIEALVCQEYKLGDEALKRGVRGQENDARKVAISLIREKAGLSCKQVARRYGIGNERSVSEYCRRVKMKCDKDKSFLKQYRKLEAASLQVET
jgi:putative transposase